MFVHMEEWKIIPLPELAYKYEASNMGRIRNQWGNILAQRGDGRGYKLITLLTTQGLKSYRVHRLILITWMPNPNNLSDVDHINGCKSDNRVSNLRWLSHKDNTNAFRKERKNQKIVCQYTFEGKLIESSTIKHFTKNGFQRSCIIDCCNGKRKTHAGFIWQYL